MTRLFANSTNGYISRWNVSNVESMKECLLLHIDGNISEWDVSNVVNMKECFKLSIQ